MEKNVEQSNCSVVFIVVVYNVIVGVYGDSQSALAVANERIMKGYHADVFCRPIL